MSPTIEELRSELHYLNHAILKLLNRRARVVTDVLDVKRNENIPLYVPQREMEMIRDLVGQNSGPFSDDTIRHLFKEIFHASVGLMEDRSAGAMRTSRAFHLTDQVIELGTERLGGDRPVLVAGPCAVENEDQMDIVARGLSSAGVSILRAGAFKPRSSPYSFQGLGVEGLKILRETADRYDMRVITEVMDTRAVEIVGEYADVLQIGTRNMYNYDLLREVGRQEKPVLLKRGFSATIDEFLASAEYIVKEGNERVILCERGIRTFERQTRNTLDISAVPILRRMTYLPVMVDISHAAGRKDILAPLGRAALAAGASGLMVEVHPFPAVARSDSQQQLDLDEFRHFLEQLGPLEKVGNKSPLLVSGNAETVSVARPLGH